MLRTECPCSEFPLLEPLVGQHFAPTISLPCTLLLQSLGTVFHNHTVRGLRQTYMCIPISFSNLGVAFPRA